MGGDELFSDTYPMKLVDNCMYEVYGKHISSISSKSDSGASISSNKGGSSTTIGRDNSSSNNWGSSNSNSRSSSNSNSDGSVSCNNSFGSDPGVSSNNGRGMRLLDRLLGAGGADGICTILDDLDINNFLADSLSNLPGGADRDLVAGSDWDTVTEGSRCGNWASITISGVSISVSISISFTLTISSNTISSNTISSNTSYNSSNNSSGTNSADNRSSGNSTISRYSVSWNTSSNNLGVLAYNSRAVSALGACLLALGGDNLFTMFSDGGVNNFIMFGVANFSWGLNGPILAHFFWDRVTHWSRNCCWGNSSISISWLSISISFGSSLSSDEESLSVANEGNDSEKLHDEDMEDVLLSVEKTSHQIS